VREEGMTPYEILLSESQERMLVVAKTGHEEGVRAILRKWELEAAEIGQVTDDSLFRVLENGVTVAEIPALPLTDGCPTYEREGIEDPEIQRLRQRDLGSFVEGVDPSEALLALVGSANVASRRWIYEQYDTTVRTGTAIRPGGDAGVVRIRGTNKAVAATTDCNGRYVYLSPRRGAMIAVAEAARNLVCVGAIPTAVTNNLNFGSPLKAPIYFQFREAVVGMADACRLFETPITGGNVSFYNETDGQAIYPTPVIGMVGVVEDVDHLTTHEFKAEGDTILLLGDNSDEMGGSEFLYALQGEVAGEPPQVDLEAERRLQHAVLALVRGGLLRSAHDCAEGGLACALVESALGDGERPLGIEVEIDEEEDLSVVPLLFAEGQGRVIISCAPESVEEVLRITRDHGVPCRTIGRVAGFDDRFRITSGSSGVDLDLAKLNEAFFGTIPRIMDRTPDVSVPSAPGAS